MFNLGTVTVLNFSTSTGSAQFDLINGEWVNTNSLSGDYTQSYFNGGIGVTMTNNQNVEVYENDTKLFEQPSTSKTVGVTTTPPSANQESLKKQNVTLQPNTVYLAISTGENDTTLYEVSSKNKNKNLEGKIAGIILGSIIAVLILILFISYI